MDSPVPAETDGAVETQKVIFTITQNIVLHNNKCV